MAQLYSDLSGYKIYAGLNALGISGNTTFNAVMNKLKSLNVNDFVFFANQSALTSGITDLPVGYCLLTVIGQAGRISVHVDNADRCYVLTCNTLDMTDITAANLRRADTRILLLSVSGLSLNSGSTAVGDGEEWPTMTATIDEIFDATDYYFIPVHCNYGIITNINVSGRTVSGKARNVSGTAHTCTIAGWAIAVKKQ